MIVIHLQEAEVSRCQSSESDDHFCCWSFSDRPTACRRKNCRHSTAGRMCDPPTGTCLFLYSALKIKFLKMCSWTFWKLFLHLGWPLVTICMFLCKMKTHPPKIILFSYSLRDLKSLRYQVLCRGKVRYNVQTCLWEKNVFPPVCHLVNTNISFETPEPLVLNTVALSVRGGNDYMLAICCLACLQINQQEIFFLTTSNKFLNLI